MLHERLNFQFMSKIDVPRWNVSDKELIFILEHQPVSSCVTVLLMDNDINYSPNFTKSKVKLNVECYSNITEKVTLKSCICCLRSPILK